MIKQGNTQEAQGKTSSWKVVGQEDVEAQPREGSNAFCMAHRSSLPFSLMPGKAPGKWRAWSWGTLTLYLTMAPIIFHFPCCPLAPRVQFAK